jgi:hypothetical protein
MSYNGHGLGKTLHVDIDVKVEGIINLMKDKYERLDETKRP